MLNPDANAARDIFDGVDVILLQLIIEKSDVRPYLIRYLTSRPRNRRFVRFLNSSLISRAVILNNAVVSNRRPFLTNKNSIFNATYDSLHLFRPRLMTKNNSRRRHRTPFV